MSPQSTLADNVAAAREGDLAACGRLVAMTEGMAYGVAWQILRHGADARDAVQDAYLTAFRRLNELQTPEAFAGWLRRIVVNAALNRRRRSRAHWVSIDELDVPPVLDQDEQRSKSDEVRKHRICVVFLAQRRPAVKTRRR